MKDFPELPESDIEAKLIEFCRPLGTIVSMIVKKSTIMNKSFAFLCFSNHQEAKLAFETLKNKNPFS